MKYRYLGKSELTVSTVCLGTSTFGQSGWGCDKETAHTLMDYFLEKGGNFIDTADQYAGSASETIIGSWLKTKQRDKIVLATKCGFPIGEGVNNRGLSRNHILRACESSLTRLETEYIDLYQVYHSDSSTPVEEILETLKSLTEQGKIRYIGLSNFPAWKLAKIMEIAKKMGIYNIISTQYLYNLLKRDIEEEVMPACRDYELGVICWSPLSGGMLTGKYNDPKIPLKGTRLDARSDISDGRYEKWYKNSYDTVTEIKKISSETGQKPAVISLSWLLRNKGVTSVIAGARNLEQIKGNITASDWELSDNYFNRLNELTKILYRHPNNWKITE